MANLVATGATVLAGILAVAAFVVLMSENYVFAGTLFVMTAVAIYIREMNL
jgi:hypothetical protein